MVDRGVAVRLAEAGWTPRQWGVEINRLLVGRGRRDRIHPTGPYHWVKSDRPPKDSALAILAAEALSIRLGRPVSVTCLWSGQGGNLPTMAPATEGLLGPVTGETVLAGLDQVAGEGGVFLPASAIQLLTAVHDGIRAPGLEQPGVYGSDRLLPPMLTVIRSHIAELRRLDDRAGGGAVSLRYVRAELRAVLDLLRHASFEAAVGQQLLAAAAELCQLTAWMWFDGGDVGRSQRTFLLGVRLARAAEDDDVLANMLGMLAYITAHGSEPQQALRLAEHANVLARRRGPMLRSRIAGRLATAHAAAGDIYGYRSAADAAHAQLTDSPPREAPSFLYYLSDSQLRAESGQALVHLAERNPAHRRALLHEAVEHLIPLTAADLRQDYQRSALLHGCYLAQAHLAAHDIEQAARAISTALTRLPAVQSRRCVALLTGLRASFARRRRNPWARDACDQLDEALSRV
ncbi:MAG: hypothetical protein ACRDT0_21160 [Pseudonocardiaceae bacterium]